MNQLRSGVLLGLLLCFGALSGCQDQASSTDESRGVSVDTRTDSVMPEADELGVYHALIIGVNDYQKWPQLKFAYQDADDIRKILTSRYRFDPENVSFLGNKDATLKNIVTVMTRLLSTLTEKDNLLIYYAGHGQLDPLTDSGYWIPVDGDIYDETSWVRFSTITEKITSQNVKLKNILLITDSCYGGALSRSGPTPGKANPDQDGEQEYLRSLSEIAPKKSRQVVASGGFEEVPDQSVFGELLRRNLRDNTMPLVDVEYLFFKNVLPALIKVGVQRPRISKLASGLNIDGQFIFALRDASLLATPASDLATDHDSTETDRGDATPAVTPTVTAPVATTPTPAPQIVKFNANPLELQPGQMVTVEWETKNAVAVTLNGSTVALSGATKMLPPKSTTFTLNVVNADGKVVSSNLAIEVIQPVASITRFEISPSTIKAGESAELHWQTSGAEKVEIVGIGELDAKGSYSVSPRQSTNYELRVSNSGGSDKQTVQLKVQAAEPPAPTPTRPDRVNLSTIDRAAITLQKPAIAINRATAIAALANTIVASGTASIKQTYTADLDTAGAPSNANADIWFEAKTATDRWLVPRGTALIAAMTTSEPGLSGCQKAALAKSGVNIASLRVGSFLCVKTTDGHFSQIKVMGLPAARVGVLDIQFTTWK